MITANDFIALCQRALAHTKQKVPAAIAGRLSADKEPRRDKKPQNLQSTIVDRPKNGFWDRHYSAYAVVYDPLTGVGGTWTVRFMHHHSRADCGSGKYAPAIRDLLKPFDGCEGFEFEYGPNSIQLRRFFHGTDLPDLEPKIAAALEFLIANLHSRILSIIAQP
jgi:hypothetical protein